MADPIDLPLLGKVRRRERSLEGRLSCSACSSLRPTLGPTSRYQADRAGTELAFSQAHLMLSACKIFMKHHDGLLTWFLSLKFRFQF